MFDPLGVPLVPVAWEFSDGSGGMKGYDVESALPAALGIARAWPDARVWCGADQVQRGFIASDEHGDMYGAL